MKAMATLGNLKSESDRCIIVRNLSKIMDIRIVDIDIENRMLIFLYENPLTFGKVERELLRLGYPINSCRCRWKSKNLYPAQSESQRSGLCGASL